MYSDSDEIWVAGYHVEDLSTQVDLTKLGVQDILKFDQGILMVKKGCQLEIFHGDYSYVFTIELKPGNCEENDDYYIMKGGRKYELEGPPKRFSLSESTEETNIVPEGHKSGSDGQPAKSDKTAKLRIPCSLKAWGGGGINLVLTLRNLSHRRITKIRYWDAVFGPSVQLLVQKLQDLHNESADKSSEFDDKRINKIIDIVADHGPDECIEIFLKTKHIEAELFPLDPDSKEEPLDPNSKGKPHRANLVFSRVTDGINTIGDRIILKFPVPKIKSSENAEEKEQMHKKLVEHIIRSQEHSSTVVVNTVKHYEVFEAILSAFRLRMEADKHKDLKLFIMFTDDNRKWFELLKSKNDDLYESIRKNIWAIFNEREFSKFMSDIDMIKPAAFLFDNGTPNFKELLPLCAKFGQYYPKNVKKRLYVTLGKHGSAGVDEHSCLIYVQTYPTRGVPIYDTTGSGDAWAGTVVLLEHHAHLLKREKAEMSRFMRIASGTAWAKMTSPLGEVRVHELISLLDNDYIAWTNIGDAHHGEEPMVEAVNREGYAKRIEKASSINYKDYSNIINWA
ncbi:MAG: hypothetical protein LLG93_12290 [Deltaproteobacteria bacterium]|nr:hypothetical protein [Deltaproteobacteria bacterium]